jgi:hypothetical protein
LPPLDVFVSEPPVLALAPPVPARGVVPPDVGDVAPPDVDGAVPPSPASLAVGTGVIPSPRSSPLEQALTALLLPATTPIRND